MHDSSPRRAPIGRSVYVDYETGFEVTDAQYSRIETLLDAAEGLFKVMHDADGSVMPGERQEHVWSSSRMRRAAEHLEVSLMYAKRAALEAA